jgi:heat shock protein HtpX
MNNLLSSYYSVSNYLSSIILLAGMLSLLGLIGWLIAGASGIAMFLAAGALVLLSAPRVTPQFILRLHQARRLQPGDAPKLYEVIVWLAERAGLKKIPVLYYFPSDAINAFTTGLYNSTSIAISDGMLHKLDSRELTGVLAHEISHIRNHDLLVMLMAEVMSRLTSVMAFTGYMLILIYIPMYVMTGTAVSWLLLIVLMMAPTVSIIMQMTLSRLHEFSADTTAAKITGDPLGLASALEKIDYYQGGWVERMFIPSRRRYQPALLRTHPLMTDRIRRLRELAEQMPSSDHPFDSVDRFELRRYR